MPAKTIHIEGVGDVKLTKRKGSRAIKITLKPGQVTVTQPTWLPYSAGEAFIAAKLNWIKQKYIARHTLYEDGQTIGTRHILRLSYGTDFSSRVKTLGIYVQLPRGEDPANDKAQAYIEKAVFRALRQEGESFLPKRTKQLADFYGFTYKSVRIKLLSRRWGSCSSHKDITYNLKLMSLASEYIDYVILHELTHTEHMNHGPDFWAKLESVYPGAKKVAKIVRRIEH